MQKTRLGCVSYMNTVPLIEGLDRLDDLELVPMVPAKIGDSVASGDVDLGLVSLIDAARAPSPLAPIPVGMIGCDGPTLTVQLYSKVPTEQISRVDADSESHTSAALCQIILKSLHGVSARVVPHDYAAASSQETPETVLLIGDKVVTDPPCEQEYPHRIDLGLAWKELTGLGVVYATWMCREDRADDPRIHAAATVLDRQRRRNEMRLDWIVSKHAAAHGWPVDQARHYLTELLRFDVGPEQMLAAQRLIDDAAALGLCEARELKWVGCEACV